MRSAPIAAPAPPPPVAPGSAVEPQLLASVTGVASWYGPGFHGRPTASGESFDQHELTAASTVIPIGSRVIVTNLSNGRSVEVTINDHGPFVKGRTLDLSYAAARVLDMTNDGTAPVRMDVVSVAPGARPVGSTPRFAVQVGSFAAKENAERLRALAAQHFAGVAVVPVTVGNRRYYRVRAGSFATRHDAERRARDAARLGMTPVLVVE
jgi:rare lipoprotein A